MYVSSVDIMTAYCFSLLQDKGRCPRLREIALAGMDLLSEASNASSSAQGKKNQCVRSYIDGLFAFFFSAQRAAINTEDANWFLEIANKHAQTDFTQAVAASDDASPPFNCISLNVFKLYLSRILGSVDVSKEQTINPKVNVKSRSNSSIQFTLLIVHLQTKEMIALVLMSQGVSGSPGPYIPPFYQLEGSLHIYSIEASKVREHGNIINSAIYQPLPLPYISERLDAAALSSPILPDGT